MYINHRDDVTAFGDGGHLGKIGAGKSEIRVAPFGILKEVRFYINMVNTSANSLSAGKLKLTELIGYQHQFNTMSRLQPERKKVYYTNAN